MNIERIREEYQIIHPQYQPDFDPLMPGVEYDAVVTHAHFTKDVTSRLSTMVHAAVEAGIDTIWTSGHDTPREYDLVSQVVSDRGYHLEVKPAIEISARGPHDQLRHVIAYGVEDAPPPGLTPEGVNEWAHKQGPHVKTGLAHPELLYFSVRRHELAANQELPSEQRYDIGEIANGGVVSINAWREKHPVLAKVLAAKMPSEKANETMSEIVLAQFELPALGGDDFHHPSEVGNVVNLVPRTMDIFDAAKSGQLLIAVRREPIVPATWRFGVGTFRGAMKDRQIMRQWPKAPARAAA